MSNATRDLLKSTRAVLEGSVVEKAEQLLDDPEANVIAGEPSNEEAGQLLPTLRARLSTARQNNRKIFGLAHVIARLEKIPPKTKVLGYGIKSPKAAGNIYVREDGREALGATIVQFDQA